MNGEESAGKKQREGNFIKVQKEKGGKMGKSFIKRLLIYTPVAILIVVFSVLAVRYFLRKRVTSRSVYEETLAKFYDALAGGETNVIMHITTEGFENTEAGLPIEKKNYMLFSYSFQIITNEIESNRVELGKILYSIVIQTRASNISLVKEAYFTTPGIRLSLIKDIYIGKEITKKR